MGILTMPASFTLDSRAATGFSNAAAYDLHRPTYPREAVDKLLNHIGVAGVQNAKIIDLEPHAGMRDVLVKKGLSRVRVEAGDAGNMPIEEDWGDACVAAQAFHWFATESSLKETHRVLRPGAL